MHLVFDAGEKALWTCFSGNKEACAALEFMLEVWVEVGQSPVDCALSYWVDRSGLRQKYSSEESRCTCTTLKMCLTPPPPCVDRRIKHIVSSGNHLGYHLQGMKTSHVQSC